jgi:broad specificity phosphatase PhoE
MRRHVGQPVRRRGEVRRTRASRAYFLTHPEVEVDPDVLVPQWGLAQDGRRRLDRVAREPWPRPSRPSPAAETKARETAGALAALRGVHIREDHELGENDRSATDFLRPPEFEATADEFFSNPDVSIRGWETAQDAQERILRAVDRAIAAAGGGDIAVVSHGGVGTLFLCHLIGVPIDRQHDQPGQGSFFCFDPGGGSCCTACGAWASSADQGRPGRMARWRSGLAGQGFPPGGQCTRGSDAALVVLAALLQPARPIAVKGHALAWR